ncbi:hypothetical protein D9M68_793920 [compost metagenome]
MACCASSASTSGRDQPIGLSRKFATSSMMRPTRSATGRSESYSTPVSFEIFRLSALMRVQCSAGSVAPIDRPRRAAHAFWKLSAARCTAKPRPDASYCGLASGTGGGSTAFSTKPINLLSCARTPGGSFVLGPSSAPSMKL